MDVGCYALHANRALGSCAGGEPSVAAVRGRQRADAPGVDEWGAADLLFPSGATGSAHWNMDAEAVVFSLEVTGSNGSARAENFVLAHLDNRLTVRTAGGGRVQHLGTGTSYTYQLGAFTAAVREGRPLPTDADDAVRTMALIDQSYQAMGLGLRPSWAGPAATTHSAG